MSGFKLDVGSIHSDEKTCDFLAACGRLDLKGVRQALQDEEGKSNELANTCDSVGQNGIFYVVGSCQHDLERQNRMIRLLHAQGADVNAKRSTDGWTALFLAVIFDLRQIVSSLVHLGAVGTARDNNGLTPEDWARKYRLREVQSLLLHSRSKVPHSRFSCVQQGPALEPPSPGSIDSISTSTEETCSESTSSSSTIPRVSSNDQESGVAATSSEACLLTAQ